MTRKPINAFELVVDADKFRELERCRLRALVEKDLALAVQLHSVDFQLITPTGHVYSRQHYLGEIETGLLNYISWEPMAMEVRMQDRMTLLRYQATLEVDSGEGRSAPFRCWHIDSYELIDGLWQVVWSQATIIR